MFVAWREILAARGRVGLIAGVVGLITVLLIMLTGLTEGLSQRNTSAVEAIDRTVSARGWVFSTPEPSFTESQFTQADFAGELAGAVPVGVAQTRLESADSTASVAMFGLPEGFAAPGGQITAEGVLVSAAAAADLHVTAGDSLRLGGQPTTVAAVVDNEYYSHVPVVWGPTQLWSQVAHVQPGVVATVAVLPDTGFADAPELADAQSVDAPAPAAVPLRTALTGLPAYSSERGSLVTMQGFLYAIAALVTVAFLSVWTVQRTRELAILRALGAGTGYLLRDALGQAAVLLALGTGTGLLVASLAGWALVALGGGAIPFVLTWATAVGPALGIWALGMLGALLATRRVTTTNPLIALGGQA
ncbi:ABC transporter permease [Corynebacterium lizhenjunii]|uniref:ABC transporter permease n=1 Tax=Corynebacterium lizhenjunii TaxID=2709394 RepID=A0A7T0PBW8_9CORY|nr:ABC transporter permease [Corynebacterium lizhenjunii]QPK79082.1 ABC transporter permease [Corynebacterium lizhenjunii]